MVDNIGDNLAVMATLKNGTCYPTLTMVGSVCLYSGVKNVGGLIWWSGARSKNGHLAVLAKCERVQYADIYYIAVPGEKRKPYSNAVTKQFDNAAAVDWSTNFFKTSHLDVVQNIISQHAQSLNGSSNN
jgi:hypothetical protein